jgi:hypothetical protein
MSERGKVVKMVQRLIGETRRSQLSESSRSVRTNHDLNLPQFTIKDQQDGASGLRTYSLEYVP